MGPSDQFWRASIYVSELLLRCYLGVDGQFTVTIVSSPIGTPVNGSTNTFDYPILSSVTLTCNVTSNDASSFTVTSYQWNTDGCYNHTQFTGSNPQCFPHGQTTQNVSGNNLNAVDAGTITCNVTINGSNYTSEPFTLRISGEQLVYCVIACIVYSYYYYLLHATVVLYTSCYGLCMYRGVFILGVVVTKETLFLANALTDRLYINARDDMNTGTWSFVARCITGLGPSGDDNNRVLGGLHFNGNMIPNSAEWPRASCSSETDIFQVRPGPSAAGVINMFQCGAFSTTVEGIYTCTMMNSSMMYQSIRFGVYFSVRSESLDLYVCISNHLTIFHLLMQLLQ